MDVRKQFIFMQRKFHQITQENLQLKARIADLERIIDPKVLDAFDRQKMKDAIGTTSKEEPSVGRKLEGLLLDTEIPLEAENRQVDDFGMEAFTPESDNKFEKVKLTSTESSVLSFETEEDSTVKIVVALIISYGILMMSILCYAFVCKSRLEFAGRGHDHHTENPYYEFPRYEWLTDYFINKLYPKDGNTEDENGTGVKKKSLFGKALSKVKLKGQGKRPEVTILNPIDEEEEVVYAKRENKTSEKSPIDIKILKNNRENE
ncbi:DgyrCDS10475 [Dimorphilus gyrociliatus]|uniref:DgyrCDS10475 n=1 Tax=Dimorphilus gyrociliatus TaxID=2664684 RepID=A0A7I8W0E4_9ANNE|nr:DgyrCDS10475 [Dimorphilus gyrociliatus]